MSSAASFSCENAHSYGYEMNDSMRGRRMTATAPGERRSVQRRVLVLDDQPIGDSRSWSPDWTRYASQSAAAGGWTWR